MALLGGASWLRGPVGLMHVGTAGTEPHAGDIVALLDHLGWRQAILIGHSMGGRHASVAAAHYPDRFCGLVPVLDLWQVLEKIACPTLAIRGARSDMFAVQTAPRVLAANPRIKVVEVDAGHNVAGQNPVGFQDATRAFIDSIGAAAA